jgi:hypothetical protein
VGATLALLFGAVSSLFIVRARSMRSLAARWGFRYVGPRAPSFWGFRDFRKVKPPVPLPGACHLVGEIRQAWNVIEGQQNGVSVLIFDSVIWGAPTALLSRPNRTESIRNEYCARSRNSVGGMDSALSSSVASDHPPVNEHTAPRPPCEDIAGWLRPAGLVVDNSPSRSQSDLDAERAARLRSYVYG